MELARRRVDVVNASGLHARPCHAVVSTSLGFEAELRVSCGGREVNGKSIIELMTLKASFGSVVELVARGSDAENLVGRIAALFESGFEEAF